jgi:SAM-dependent methyltransferase
MDVRTVSEEELARLKAAREEADRRYNEALTALDAAVQPVPDLAPPAAAPDDHQLATLNERWEVLRAASPLPGSWRGRLARFVRGIVDPIFAEQQAFNSALVDHVNRNQAAAHGAAQALDATVAQLRQHVGPAVQFQSRLMQFAQQLTAYVDTKDYEFHGLGRRVDEDALERVTRVEVRLDELRRDLIRDLEREMARVDAVMRGLAGGMSGLSDEMLKRFESSTARHQRAEAGLGEIGSAVASVQQLTQTLRRDLERRVAGTVPMPAATPGAASGTAPGATSGAAPGVAASTTPSTAPSTPSTATGALDAQQLLASDPIHSRHYAGFEDLYRGSEVDIASRMADYVDLFRGGSDVLDVGCGRGEFLTLLRDAGVSARGIDLNHEMVARCRADGLDVTEADALSYLGGLPDDSLGGLIATQVVEHLPPDYLLRLLTLAFDKLRPQAWLVLETINPASWAAFFDSYIRDLTHVRPVHPDTLKYLVTASGFTEAAVSWRSPYPAESKLQPLGEAVRAATAGDATLGPLAAAFDHNVERLNGLFFTYMDYAVIARRA